MKRMPEIKKVVFNPPATVVLWDDGTKTVVKAGAGQEFSEEVGLAEAIAKKYAGNRSRFKKMVRDRKVSDIPKKFEETITLDFADPESDPVQLYRTAVVNSIGLNETQKTIKHCIQNITVRC